VIEELRRKLAEEGLVFDEGTIRRFLVRHPKKDRPGTPPPVSRHPGGPAAT
jgi:hypothetical protein